MGFYRRVVLPRLIDFAMKQGELQELRTKIVPQARGRVLEIGVGSGSNLEFYGSGIVKLYAVDQSPELLSMARRKVRALPFPVVLVLGTAEELPIPDGQIDTVVMTFSLCSIAKPAVALTEARRVLKPGGLLLFAEHGLSPDAGVQTWQNRLTPIWRRLAGGCHLNRKMDDLIRSGGFSIGHLEARYIPGPRFATYMFTGSAVRT
jgi:ubiquinone/menaquinone biosynthesis C-methylase UbiE